MYPNFKILPKEDKADLRARIAQSIALEKKRSRKKNIFTLSLSFAAVLFIGFVINSVFKQEAQNISPIEQFANQTSSHGSFEKSDQVKLVLADKHTVTIGDTTTIAYNESGGKIHVNNKEIDQKESLKLQYNTVLVPYGKRAHLSLSDGTEVWLNSGSKLIYPVAFSSKNREVFLEGEGIFDVAHNAGKPFFVKAANNYSVRVLGTLFNISSYAADGKVTTALLRGKVQVAYAKKGFFNNDTIQAVLNPGMIAALDKKNQTIKTIAQNVEPLFSWRKGYYEFSQEKLSMVLEKLTRYYNIDFVMNQEIKSKETYSGAIKLNDDIDKVVSTLEAITGLDLTYDVKSRKITIN